MKLQPDRFDAPAISAYGPGWIAVDGERRTHSLIVCATGSVLAWDCLHFDKLDSRHFEQLALHDAEIVIFGSGARLRFPRPQWLRPLVERRVGVETMDTAAACRTYNILASEGRRVVAALLLEAADDRSPGPVSG